MFIHRVFFLEDFVNGIVFDVSFSLCLLLVNRKTTEFCICILYPMGLLNVWVDHF